MNEQITCPHCGDTYPDFDVAHVCSKGPYAVKLKPKMNERIKQLWEEAAKTTQGDSWEEQIKFMERFAELIVRECARVADLADENKCEWIGGNILTHFGVEE